MKNFAQIMGLLFGSVGAHTYQKSEQVPPLPHLGEQNFPTQTSNIFATLFHDVLVFFQELPSGGGGAQYLLLWDQVLDKSLRGGQKAWGGRLLPIVEERHHKFNLSIQSFCPVAFTCLILQFCLFRKDFFHLTCSIYFWNFSHFRPSHAY